MRRLTAALLAATLAFAAAAAGPGTIEPKALNDRIAWADRSLLVLDVRTPEEFAAGHLPGAIHVSKDNVAERLPPNKDATLVFYCANPK